MKNIYLILLITFGVYYYYPETKLPKDVKIDSIVVMKSERKLMVYEQGKLIKTYKISLGINPIGDKEFEGDKKTPEGKYKINDKNPNSGYYKNLGVSYPNADDIKYSKKLNKPVGGNIKIHGLPNKLGFIGKFQRWMDWTAGCMALTNEEMDELFESVKIGSTIEIKP